MTDSNDFIQDYALTGADGETIDSDARVAEWEIDGRVQPTVGPANVIIKQIVMTA